MIDETIIKIDTIEDALEIIVRENICLLKKVFDEKNGNAENHFGIIMSSEKNNYFVSKNLWWLLSDYIMFSLHNNFRLIEPSQMGISFLSFSKRKS